MTGPERVLLFARLELGYLEKASNAQLDDKTANAGYKNWNKYARDLDNQRGFYNGNKNGYDWCDVFVDWCFVKAFGPKLGQQLLCQPERSLGAGVKYSAQYYRDKGRFYERDPRPGDQIFFVDGGRFYHTGIVEKAEGSRVHTIEGNTSSGPGVEPNGGGVFRKSYPLGAKYIGGYGRPDWSLVKEVSKVSYEQWKEYMERYLDELAGLTADAWAKPYIQQAIDAGAMTENAAGTIDRPKSFVTRQEAAVIAAALK